MHIETSAGSRDTDVKELIAMPVGTPSISAHRATTPDGKQAKTDRKLLPSI